MTGIVIAVALLLPMGVLAQGKGSGSASQAKEKVEAKAHYDQGTVHFNLDEWPQAIEEFKNAYRLFPDANFLYNIAQCHRKMGNVAEALSFYKKFQRERPDAPNRTEVEKRIEELEAAKASKAREVPPPPLSTPPTPLPAPPVAPLAPPAKAAATPPVAAPPAEPAPMPAIGPAAPPVAEPDTMRPAGVDLATSPPSGQAAGSDSVLKKWWFWTGVGVVVAAGGVTMAYLLSSSKSASHYQGNLTPPVLTVP